MTPMRKIIYLLIAGSLLLMSSGEANGQVAVKINVPVTLVGSPNVGTEITLSQQFTVNGDFLWLPYLFKKKEEVFRALQMSVDLRYYPQPRYYYTSAFYDGFYVGPYAMYGNFNIGLATHDDPDDDIRYRGWGISGGVSVGYKFFLSTRFRLDLNVGLGYAHLQYNTYQLGGMWAEYPMSIKDTKEWIGPTKFGVHVVYNLFR